MADAIFLGDVVTMSDSMMQAEAIAVKDGKILFVGNKEDVQAFQNAKTKINDLGSSTILPGLIEAHTHPNNSADQYFFRTDITGYDPMTFEEVWATIRNKVHSTPPGEWVVFIGLNPMLVKGIKSPTREELDAISMDHPILIISQSHHSCFVNSKVLEVVGINEDSPDPPGGGKFVRDEHGRLTGRMVETAVDLMKSKMPVSSLDQGRKNIQSQLDAYAKAGYTTVGAAGIFPIFPNAFDVLKELVSSSLSPIRVVVYEAHMHRKNPEEPKGHPGVDQFCKVGVKWWADGSPYSGSMATAEPYLDTAITRDALQFDKYPHYGHLNYSVQEFYKELLSTHQKGLQIAVHCHGERAIDLTLDVYEALLNEFPRQDHRYRIEHCGLITEAQLSRAKVIGVTPSFYLDHIHFFGKVLRDGILGSERASRFMPLNQATKIGHLWSLHSDSPCSPLGPFRVLKTAVTRTCRRDPWESPDAKLDVVGPEEKVGIDQALKAYTTHPAWQMFHEEVLGSIQPNKLADFTVVSENPRTIDPYELDTIEVVATYRSGKLTSPFNPN